MGKIKLLRLFFPPPLLKDIKSSSWQLPGFAFWAAQALCRTRPFVEPVSELCFGGVLQHVTNIVKSASDKHNT